MPRRSGRRHKFNKMVEGSRRVRIGGGEARLLRGNRIGPLISFFTRGQKLKVKDPWHILSGYDLEFAGMSTRERVRVMLEWFGRRQTIALPINSVVGCPDCANQCTLTLLLRSNRFFGRC